MERCVGVRSGGDSESIAGRAWQWYVYGDEKAGWRGEGKQAAQAAQGAETDAEARAFTSLYVRRVAGLRQ